MKERREEGRSECVEYVKCVGCVDRSQQKSLGEQMVGGRLKKEAEAKKKESNALIKRLHPARNGHRCDLAWSNGDPSNTEAVIPIHLRSE
jgi:hypothetical protein